MSRELMHTLEPFSAKSPNALPPMCKAAHARFAHSEQEALQGLLSETLALIGSNVTMREINSYRFSDAGLGGTPFVNTLVDALERKGVYSDLPPELQEQSTNY